MKIPRDITGTTLVKRLSKYGYSVTRQTGSHIRLTTHENGKYSITIPSHNPIKVGTLSSILNDIAKHHNITKQKLIDTLF